MTGDSRTRAPDSPDGHWTGHLDTRPIAMDGDPFDLLGDVLDGQFRVDAFVGEGDLSVVYKGHDLAADAPVTVKCLNLPDTLDPALTRPVIESFDAANRLHHRLSRGSPHIARSIAAGRTIAPRTGANLPYLVREWFDGESLASELARRRSEGKKGRSVEETIALLEPAMDGIAYAHEHGVAHLALNPDNLFVARTGSGCALKVLDFGAARAVDRSGAGLTADSPLTSGLQLLRPAYAAPEQLDKTAGKPGTWTDVYALALIMMEVLSDRAERQGADTPALVERALDDRKRPTPEAHGLKLPRGLDLVLTRAVSRAPGARQRDARTFWTDVKTGLRVPVATALPAVRAAPTVDEPSPPSRQEPPRPPRGVAGPPPAPPIERPKPTLVLYAPPPLPTPPQPMAPAPPATPIQPDPVAPEAWAPQPAAPALGVRAPLFPSEPHAPTPLAFDAQDPGPATGRWSSDRARAVVGGAALLFTAVLAVLAIRRPTPAAHAAPPTPAAVPSSVAAAQTASSMAPAVVPSPAAPPATSTAAATSAFTATSVASTAVPARSARVASASPHNDRFSPMAARRALYTVTHKVARCRHGRFWGSGYATIVFKNDGSVEHVFVDPPFSMTVAGKCVAQALSAAHIPSFDGGPGSLRLRFRIARG